MNNPYIVSVNNEAPLLWLVNDETSLTNLQMAHFLIYFLGIIGMKIERLISITQY